MPFVEPLAATFVVSFALVLLLWLWIPSLTSPLSSRARCTTSRWFRCTRGFSSVSTLDLLPFRLRCRGFRRCCFLAAPSSPSPLSHPAAAISSHTNRSDASGHTFLPSPSSNNSLLLLRNVCLSSWTFLISHSSSTSSGSINPCCFSSCGTPSWASSRALCCCTISITSNPPCLGSDATIANLRYPASLQQWLVPPVTGSHPSFCCQLRRRFLAPDCTESGVPPPVPPLEFDSLPLLIK